MRKPTTVIQADWRVLHCRRESGIMQPQNHLSTHTWHFSGSAPRLLVQQGLLHISARQSHEVAEAELLLFALWSQLIAMNVRKVACQLPDLFPHNPQIWESLNWVMSKSGLVASAKIPNKSQLQANPRLLAKWHQLEWSENSSFDVIAGSRNF